MYKYSNEELSNKINDFLDRKSQKFPEIEEEIMKPIQRISVTQSSRLYQVSTIQQMNTSAWAAQTNSKINNAMYILLLNCWYSLLSVNSLKGVIEFYFSSSQINYASQEDIGIQSPITHTSFIRSWYSYCMKVTVNIKPNTKHREEVVITPSGDLIVYTKQPAVEGRANQAVIRLLANYYRVSKSQVELIQGHTSKFKVFRIDIQAKSRQISRFNTEVE